jgi:hypothetical protein
VSVLDGLLYCMTLVNWERLPGETVEELVAAMLLLRHPHGNRITPSRGDRGVDIRIANPDGYDIYQVKRFCRPLTSRQVTDVENSWQRFVDETLPVLPVRSWTLVTPWNPTHERLEWLERLTAGSGLRISWMDRDHLDGMAADHPALIAYYFGDGGERIQHLMAQALQGGRDMPGPGQVPAENLLTAAIERYEGLAAALTDVDPFYRYAFDVREGRVSEQPWDGDVLGDDLTAFVRYLQLNERHYLVMRLVARAVESFSLRPITGSLELQVPVDSAERQAVEEFLHYGAPFADIDGTITHSSGPPGLPEESGPGRLSFIVAAGAAGDRPDLESAWPPRTAPCCTRWIWCKCAPHAAWTAPASGWLARTRAACCTCSSWSTPVTATPSACRWIWTIWPARPRPRCCRPCACSRPWHRTPPCCWPCAAAPRTSPAGRLRRPPWRSTPAGSSASWRRCR